MLHANRQKTICTVTSTILDFLGRGSALKWSKETVANARALAVPLTDTDRSRSKRFRSANLPEALEDHASGLLLVQASSARRDRAGMIGSFDGVGGHSSDMRLEKFKRLLSEVWLLGSRKEIRMRSSAEISDMLLLLLSFIRFRRLRRDCSSHPFFHLCNLSPG